MRIIDPPFRSRRERFQVYAGRLIHRRVGDSVGVIVGESRTLVRGREGRRKEFRCFR